MANIAILWHRLRHATREEVVLALLVFATVFDMAGELGIKYAAFVLAGANLALRAHEIRLSLAEILVGGAVFVIWPFIALINGHMEGGSLAHARSDFAAPLLAFGLLALIRRNMARLVIALIAAAVFSLAVALVVPWTLLLFFPRSQMILAAVDLLASSTHYGAASSPDVPTVARIYFRAALFFGFGFSYYLFRDRTILASVCAIALALSVAKGGLIASALILSVYLARVAATRPRRLLTMLPSMVAIVLLVALAIPGLPGNVSAALTGEARTTQERLEHVESIAALIQEKPSVIVIGAGLGTTFYSRAVDHRIHAIEIAPLDAVWKFGLPWVVVLGFLGARIVNRLVRERNPDMDAIAMALVYVPLASLTNAILLNPLFAIAAVAAYRAVARSPAELDWTNPGVGSSTSAR